MGQLHPQAIFSRLVSATIVRARDSLADALAQAGVAPNVLTLLGLLVTLAAAVLLALGAGDRPGSPTRPGYGWHGLWAAGLLILANACDMLDGAVARRRRRNTQLGAFLDSCVDRLSDGLIFFGILLYYLRHPELPHARLFAALTVAALLNSELISYVKARAENFISSCPVGYWQRGERSAAILIGLFCGHLATVMAMLATLAGLTALRRLRFAAAQIRRLDDDRPLLDPHAPLQGLLRLAPWRYPRRTLPYDLTTAANIALILFLDLRSLP